MQKRRREKRTDYAQRLALLKSAKPRLVVRRSTNSFHLQIVQFDRKGGRTVVEMSSLLLKKHGWKGHCGNIPAAYLSGFLLGKMALQKGVKEIVPDLGLQISVRGNSLYACLSGAKEAGLNLNIGDEALPAKERVDGTHVAAYAKTMQGDSAKYSKHFSGYLKNGLDPQKLPEHFKEVKNKLVNDNGLGAKN